jgi:iron complex outermembrane receptor protein
MKTPLFSRSNRFRLGVLSLAIATQLNTVAAAPANQSAAASANISFNIPSQKLISSLSAFAEQSGLQLLYSAELAEGKQAPTLSGSFNTEQGLQRLLKDSGLSFRFVDQGVVTIEKQAQANTKPVVTNNTPAKAAVDTNTLAETVVTANPVIESVQLDAFSTTSALVTEEQLRDQNAVDLAAALRRTPGVQISRFNPVGSFGGEQDGMVLIRGQGASRPGSEIKTYVDGVPISMGLWSHPLLDLLPINGMQSITVHKSPQPQFNGNNFASINLDSKRAKEDGIHGGGRLSGGFFGTINEQADVQGRKGDLDFSLAQGYTKSDGHRDNADGELRNVMGHVGYQINQHWATSVNFLYTDSTATDPGDARYAAPKIAPQYTTTAGMVSANLNHEHGSWKGEFKLFHNEGEGNWLNHNFYGLTRNTYSSFSTDGIRWKEQFSPWAGGTLSAGIDNDWIAGSLHYKDQFNNASFDEQTFTITSPFAALSQDIVLNKDWTLVPSVGSRFYAHSEFDSAWAPHAGLSLVSDKLTVFGNISRGTNYPGLETSFLTSGYMPFFGTSWKNLSPEEMDHFEIGAKVSPFSTTQIDVSFFSDHIKNRYIMCFPPSCNAPVFTNYGAYHMRGMELAVKQQLGFDWTAFAGLTLLDPTIKNLPYTPGQAISAGLNGPIGPLRFAFDLQYQSRVWAMNRGRDGSTNSDQVDSFTVANTRLGYPIKQLGKKGEVFVSVDNLFDNKYAYRPGYAMPGISGQVGIAASF